MNMLIQRIDAEQTTHLLPSLVALLQDAVANGGSLGFLPPLSDSEATRFLQGVLFAVRDGQRILLVAREGEQIVGTVQLVLEDRPNGIHRAEVIKLMVHSTQRHKGIGRALMLAVEEEARQARRTLLLLDTRQGDVAEQLYRSIGYTLAGVIPRYARGADGHLHATVFLYKLLDEAH
jgi:ribosomal protein S18 acetylase RimI-like enzyme